MKIRIENETGRPIPREHVVARMTAALRRIDRDAATAHVIFSDVNGPKGGADVRCGLVIAVPGRRVFRVERTQTTPRLAFDEGYASALREVERVCERRRDAERRPKKYFAAKRLLAPR